MIPPEPYLILKGGQILTMDGNGDGPGTVQTADIVIVDGIIDKIVLQASLEDYPQDATVINIENRWVVPGFVQGHVHLCQTSFRNLADDLPLLDWLSQKIWPFEVAHNAASVKAAANLGIWELLRSGTTTALDMGTVRHTDAIFEAARESGIRLISGKCMMDRDAGQPAGLKEGTKEALTESDALCERWDTDENDRLSYAYCPRFSLTSSEDLLHETSAAARDRNVRIHTHAAETTDENRHCHDRHGASNIGFLAAMDMAGPDVNLAHCVHIDESDIGLLKNNGSSVTHCPTANLKLGSGIAPVPELLEAGIKLSLGADGAACNNHLDIFSEMRLAALLQKIRKGPDALPAKSVLEMATIGGARALGMDDRIGSIEEGKQADIVVLNLDSPTSIPGDDPYSRIVYSAHPHQVEMVIVGGSILVKNSDVQPLSSEEVMARARETLAALLSRIP